MNKDRILVLAALLVGLLALGIGIFGGGKTTEVIRETVREIVGATPGGDFHTPVTFNNGITRGSVKSTSTLGTVTTLRLSDIENVDVLLASPGQAITYTFFASSTAAGWLPVAGMSQTTCVVNDGVNDGDRITWAAGTGIDLLGATSTLITHPGDIGCFQFIRASSTNSGSHLGDIKTLFSPSVDLD